MARTTVALDRRLFGDGADLDALHHQYQALGATQDVFIELCLETGRLEADYNPEVGNFYPEAVRAGRIVRWHLTATPTTVQADALVEQIRDAAVVLLDGAAIEWDGHTTVGVLDPAATAAKAEIAEILACWAEHDAAPGVVERVDVRVWLDDVETIPGITADTTDDDLTMLAEALRDARPTGSPGGYRVVIGLAEALHDCRARLRQQRRYLLSQVADDIAAELAAQATKIVVMESDRDVLIRQILSWNLRDDTLRSLGELAGVSHTGILDICALQPGTANAAIAGAAATDTAIPPALPSSPLG